MDQLNRIIGRRNTGESVKALALEGIQLVETRAVVKARRVGAFVDVDITMTAGPSRLADASVIADQIGARGGVDTRIRRAIVHVYLAIASRESGGALARVIADTVQASGAVQAGRSLTFIHVRRTIIAAKTGQTLAFKAVNEIGAGAVIPARIRLAFVDVEASGRLRGPSESGETNALVRIDAVQALGIGRTGDVEAIVDIDLTPGSGESRRARAFDFVQPGTANTSVETGIRFARDHRRFQQHLHTNCQY